MLSRTKDVRAWKVANESGRECRMLSERFRVWSSLACLVMEQGRSCRAHPVRSKSMACESRKATIARSPYGCLRTWLKGLTRGLPSRLKVTKL